MAIRSRLETKGFAEYLERLAKAGRNIDAIADEALMDGAEILEAGMHRRVAKDTGNLDDTITTEGPFREGNFHFVTVGLPKSTDAETARYGNVQEYGSANMAAQPYIRPTLDADMGKARKAMRARFEAEGVL